jgi:hypothetical protein
MPHLISKRRCNARNRFERDWAKGEERIRSSLHENPLPNYVISLSEHFIRGADNF